MESGESTSSLRWYAIHTHPRQENRAEQNLKSEGLETFAPKLRECRYNQYTGEPIPMVKPLFPRYIFARFDPTGFFHKVGYTRGVHCVVSFGGKPTPIDDAIIAFMQSRVKADGFIVIGEQFNTGDQVMIKDGLLKSFVGVFEREMKGPDRVMILLTTIGYQAHVMIDRDLLKKLS